MKIVRKKIRIFSFLFSLAMVFAAANSAPCKSDTTLDNWKEKLKIEAGEHLSSAQVASSHATLNCCQLCRGFDLRQCGCITFPFR